MRSRSTLLTIRAPVLWAVALVSVTVVGWAAVIAAGAGYPWDLYAGHFPDLISDKYTALASVDGSGPYVPLSELADRYGFSDAGWPAPHPRTPAGLLTQVPLILIPDRWMVLAGVPMMVAAVGALLWASTKIAGVDDRWGALGLFAWAASPLFSWDMLYPTAGFISWAVVLGWWWTRHRPRWAGAIFGVVAAIKLWPAVIVGVLLLRRDSRRIGVIGALTAAGLTLAGLVLPGASIGGTVEALRQAGAFFGRAEGNLSAVAAFGWPVIVVAAALVAWGVVGRVSLDWRIAAAVAAGVLSSPLVWGNYYYSLLPVAIVAAAALVDPSRRRSPGWGWD